MRAVVMANSRRLIRKRKDFLWMRDASEVVVRRRGNDAPLNIDLICDEEIAKAVEVVLEWQHATAPCDLASQASRLLGFRATSGQVASRIERGIEVLVAQGALCRLPNGLVDISTGRAGNAGGP